MTFFDESEIRNAKPETRFYDRAACNACASIFSSVSLV
jgi:hypothetical protein